MILFDFSSTRVESGHGGQHQGDREDQRHRALRRAPGAGSPELPLDLLGHHPFDLRRRRRGAGRRFERRGAAAFLDQQVVRRPTKSVDPHRPGQHRPVERAAEHRRIMPASSASRRLGLDRDIARRDRHSAGSGSSAPRSGRPAASASGSSASQVAVSPTTATTGCDALRSCASVCRLKKIMKPNRSDGREQEEDEAARVDRGDEIAPRDHPGGFPESSCRVLRGACRLHLPRRALRRRSRRRRRAGRAARSTAPRSPPRRRARP